MTSNATTQDVIKISGIHKHYNGIKAVDDLSFSVQSSHCFGLLGPNGAGKSTMIKILYGRVLRDKSPAGTVNIFGYDPNHQALQIKYISGIIPQEDNLDEELSVVQNLKIYARFYGISEKEAMPRIEELLDFMELTSKKDSRIRQLSGGISVVWSLPDL